MKKPIFIIEVDYQMDEMEKETFEESVKQAEVLKEFDVIIFHKCRARIYYPPIEVKNEPQPEQ